MPSNDDYITRREHDEFVKRMEETDKRQNKRIDALEESVKDINRLATSIEKIATSQQYMMEEQRKQGEMIAKTQEKVDLIEKSPVEDAKLIKKKTIETIVTVVVTALVVGIIAVVATYVK